MMEQVLQEVRAIEQRRADVAARLCMIVNGDWRASGSERWARYAQAKSDLSDQCGPTAPPQWQDLSLFQRAMDAYVAAMSCSPGASPQPQPVPRGRSVAGKKRCAAPEAVGMRPAV